MKLPIPDKFPLGCIFSTTFGGDNFVEFPDGTIYKLSDDDESLNPSGWNGKGGICDVKDPSGFLATAKSYRDWAININLEKHKAQLDLESALTDLGNIFGESSKLKITLSECDNKLLRSCTKMSHPDFPAFLTDKQPIESVLQSLEFKPVDFGFNRQFHGVEFDAGESFNCWFLIRAGITTKLSWTPAHDINIFTPIAPIELMSTIYKLWAETYDQKEPFDIIKGPIDSFLLLGKKWIDYRKEVNALIPPLPTIWAEREFLRCQCLFKSAPQFACRSAPV